MSKRPLAQDVFPQFTKHAGYAVDHSLLVLESTIAHYEEDWGFDMNPDFQRGHVWTREQQVAFMEFFFQGGQTGRDIYCNVVGWNSLGQSGPMLLVDGKQRLTAALAWLHNEFAVFDRYYCRDVRLSIGAYTFKWHVNDLKTRAEVLRWYLEFNSGGIVHSKEELDRVRELLRVELVNAPSGHPVQPSVGLSTASTRRGDGRLEKRRHVQQRRHLPVPPLARSRR